MDTRIKRMQVVYQDAVDARKCGDHEHADWIEDQLRELAYINACESDSPNSPDFDNVLNAELLKLGIEE